MLLVRLSKKIRQNGIRRNAIRRNATQPILHRYVNNRPYEASDVGRTHARTDVQMILYSVQCYAMLATGETNFLGVPKLMTLNDHEPEKRVLVNFFFDFGLQHIFQKQTSSKSLQDQDNLHMKFSALKSWPPMFKESSARRVKFDAFSRRAISAAID